MRVMQPLKAEPQAAPLRAVVKNGRLVLDEPSDLPEGEVVELVPVDAHLDDATDNLDDEERARLHAAIDRGLADIEAGRTVPAEDVIEKLRARRR
jgi:hypothetical protein